MKKTLILIISIIVALLVVAGVVLGISKSLQCKLKGGKWIEVGKSHTFDVKTEAECLKWGGNCVGLGDPMIVSSFKIGKCSNTKDCFREDIWATTCLMPK